MFWNILYKLCEKNSTKPYIVAKEIGVSNSVCTKWKNGSIPNGETLLKLSNYFGVSIDFLLGRTENPNISVVQTVNGNNNHSVATGIQAITNDEIQSDEMAQEMLKQFNRLSVVDRSRVILYIDDLNHKKA